MIHEEQSPLAGLTVVIKDDANELAGEQFTVEDWWDRVSGKSWKTTVGNPAVMQYATRTYKNVPVDDEVLYGKIYGMGYLVHINEIKED